MKKILTLVFAVMLLVAMTAVAAAGTTVYVTVCVDGKLEVAAQPVSVSELTADAVIKAAHAAFYPGGESGYAAGIDPTFNMFLVNKLWGVDGVPFVIVNAAPVGANPGDPTVDAYPVKNGDNVILSISSDPMTPAPAVALTVDVEGDSATITATNWILDFMTFSYSSQPFAGADVIDPATGASLGVTDAEGKVTVAAGSVAAVGGVAAIPTDGSSASVSGAAPSAPSEPSAPGMPSGQQGDVPGMPAAGSAGAIKPIVEDKNLMLLMIGGIIIIVPAFVGILTVARKEAKKHEEESARFI
jgi:hypothetical protein